MANPLAKQFAARARSLPAGVIFIDADTDSKLVLLRQMYEALKSSACHRPGRRCR